MHSTLRTVSTASRCFDYFRIRQVCSDFARRSFLPYVSYRRLREAFLIHIYLKNDSTPPSQHTSSARTYVNTPGRAFALKFALYSVPIVSSVALDRCVWTSHGSVPLLSFSGIVCVLHCLSRHEINQTATKTTLEHRDYEYTSHASIFLATDDVPGMGPFIRPSVRPPIRMYPHSQRRSMPSDELLPAKTTQAILQIFIYLSATGASSFREKGPRRPPAKSGLLQKVRTCGSTHLIRADYDLKFCMNSHTRTYILLVIQFLCAIPEI